MSITEFGDGLNVLILVEATGLDNFLSFASWYSFQKNLPNAKVAVACVRPTTLKTAVPWVYKVAAPFFYYKKPVDYDNLEEEEYPVSVGVKCEKIAFPVLTVPSYIMCLSPLEKSILDQISGNKTIINGESLSLPAKHPEPATFCSLRDGCGSFVPSKWIDNMGHPFGNTDILKRSISTANERRVFSIWEKLYPLYNTIG